jgi:hypothetical protein
MEATMFAGVGDEAAPTIATAMAETASASAAQKATDLKLENAMQANKETSTSGAIKVQNAAGITMGVWAVISAVGLWYLLRPSFK